jgi:hypothetical protein
LGGKAIAIALVVLAAFAYFTATGSRCVAGCAVHRRLCHSGLADRPRDLARACWPVTTRCRNSSGNLAMFAAIRCGSSRASGLAAARNGDIDEAVLALQVVL